MTANYREIPAHVRNLESFTGNSMNAFRNETSRGIEYVVASYGTAIGRVTPDGTARINARKYSTTTSRHQNILRAAWPNATDVPTERDLY